MWVFLLDPDYTVSFEVEFGLFGFLNSSNLFYCFVPFGIFAGFFGLPAYVFALKFFSPAIVATSFLLEPFTSQIFGYYFGIDKAPGFLTYLGTLIDIVGIFSIQQASKIGKISTEKEATKVVKLARGMSVAVS